MATNNNIFIHNIYYMLTYAFQELKQNNYEKINGENFDEILDLFAEILHKGIAYQLKQGLRKEYVSCHDSLATIRGKLDLNVTIKNRIKRLYKIGCNYDELSENNIYNQILKTTVLILLKSPDVKPERKELLRRLMLFFNNVDIIDIHSLEWNMQFGKNSKTYHMLLNVCNFIIEGLLMTTEKGSYLMRTFSDERMAKLYEKFILEYYKRHYPCLNPKAAQINWNIKKEKSTTDILPNMQSDTMLTLNDRTLIIDAKYYSKSMQYNFDKAKIHSINLYQIHSYVMNYDSEHTGKVDGMLLYAKTEEKIIPDGKMTFNDGNVIYFKSLDLNQEFPEIEKQLKCIIGEIGL